MKFLTKGVQVDKLEFTERNVATEIGLSSEAIRELRLKYLDPEEDWALVRGLVRYTKKARDILLTAVRIPPAEAPSVAPAGAEAPTQSEAAETLRAIGPGGAWTILEDPRPWRPAEVTGRYKNRRVFLARLLVEPFTIVTVRVRDSEKFLVGMEVPVRAIDVNLYELASRLPRWPGRW